MKNFHNRIWMPQIRLLVASIMVFIMLPCLPSCENNIVQPEEEVSIFHQPEVLEKFAEDEEVLRKNISDIHDNVLKDFCSKKPGGFEDKIAWNDVRDLIADSFNKEFESQNLQVRVNAVDIDLVAKVVSQVMEEAEVDFCNPENINPDKALDNFASLGYITKNEATRCKQVATYVKEGVNPYEDPRGLLTTTMPTQDTELFERVLVGSDYTWDHEIIVIFPELSLDWHALMDKIMPSLGDALGAIAGGMIGIIATLNPIGSLIGSILGALLVSISVMLIDFLGHSGLL